LNQGKPIRNIIKAPYTVVFGMQ